MGRIKMRHDLPLKWEKPKWKTLWYSFNPKTNQLVVRHHHPFLVWKQYIDARTSLFYKCILPLRTANCHQHPMSKTIQDLWIPDPWATGIKWLQLEGQQARLSANLWRTQHESCEGSTQMSSSGTSVCFTHTHIYNYIFDLPPAQ